jgi:putative transposase
MNPIVRMRERHSHPDTDIRKVDEVEEIAAAYQALRRKTVHRYWPAEHLVAVIHNPMSVVTLRRHNGEAAATPLGSHLQAQAVLDGLDVIRGSWRQTFARIRAAAAKRYSDTTREDQDVDGKVKIEKVENTSRHEINWLLRWPEHLAAIYAGGTVIPTDEKGPIAKFNGNDHDNICHWLSLALHKYRAGQPSLKHKTTFEIDDYKASVRSGSKFPVWLSMAGLVKGKPLRIPMSGDDLEFLEGTANLRVSVEPDSHGVRRIVFRRAVEIEAEERTGDGAVGIDKGANIAIAATDSDPEHAKFFGEDAGEVLGRRSERSFRRGRSQIASYADNLNGRHTPGGRFHGNPNPTAAQRRTAKHIRRNNLGFKRQDNEQRRCEAELKNVYGRAAREMMEAFPNAVEFREEQLNFKGADQKRPRKTKRKINRWAKKELSDTIGRHVSAGGARREFVNAAYTSQSCPRCSWTNRGNRKDQEFRCTHCVYRGHADAVASSNVLERGSDRTITLYTPARAVKKTLLERHTEWRESAGADARCASRGCGSDLPAVGSAGSSGPTTA